MNFWRYGIGALMVAAAAIPAFGQSDTGRNLQEQQRLDQLQQIEMDTRLRANEDIPTGQRALIDFGGYLSPQYFSIDDSNQNNHGLGEFDLVGYLRANFDGANEFFLRGHVQYNDYTPGDSFDGLGSRLIDPDFDRAYYKFDLQKYESAYNGKETNGDIVLEAGRDLVYWANGLTIAQVVDGVMPSATAGPFTVTGVAGVTPTRTVDIQPDRPEFSYDTRRGFYGGMASMTIGQQHPFIYGLAQLDYNDRILSVQGPITTKYNYTSQYAGFGSTGPISDHLRYALEGVCEFGRTLSDSSVVNGFQLLPVTQTSDNIRAYAADLKVDYTPQDEYNSRITMEGIVASGDGDRGLTNTTFNGNAPNTPDNAFNGFGILSTGLAFGGTPVSNLIVARIGGSTFPFPRTHMFRRMQLGMDLYAFNKENSDAPIDESTNPGVTYLGWEPDFYMNWEVASDVTFTMRYGVFMPNTQAFVTDKARQFLYAGAIFAF